MFSGYGNCFVGPRRLLTQFSSNNPLTDTQTEIVLYICVVFSADKQDDVSSPYHGNYGNDYHSQFDENYQIQQYHQEIRKHYAQQNPGGQTVQQSLHASTQKEIQTTVTSTCKSQYHNRHLHQSSCQKLSVLYLPGPLCYSARYWFAHISIISRS